MVRGYAIAAAVVALLVALVGVYETGYTRGSKAGAFKAEQTARLRAEQELAAYVAAADETVRLAKKGRQDDAKIRTVYVDRVSATERRLLDATATQADAFERAACAGPDSQRDAVTQPADDERARVYAQLKAYAKAVSRLEANAESCAARVERANETLRAEQELP